MKNFSLIIAIVFSVIVLIISFANWIQTTVVLFFSTFSIPLTIPFLLVSFFGIVIGACLMLFYQKKQEEDTLDENDSQDDDDF